MNPPMMPPDDRYAIARILFWLALVGLVFVFIAFAHRSASAETRFLPHPPGCPARLFCGCGASVEIFGAPIRALWPSSAWLKFPRAAPAYNRVAVRRGHVFVLKRHVAGKKWLAADYNSGGRRSRLHIRSIAGYIIVNPYAGRPARALASS